MLLQIQNIDIIYTNPVHISYSATVTQNNVGEMTHSSVRHCSLQQVTINSKLFFVCFCTVVVTNSLFTSLNFYFEWKNKRIQVYFQTSIDTRKIIGNSKNKNQILDQPYFEAYAVPTFVQQFVYDLEDELKK